MSTIRRSSGKSRSEPLRASAPPSTAIGNRPEETGSSSQIARLLAATADGDREAFKSLYDCTSSRLFGIALALCRRRDVAEDVLQEAYLRIWGNAHHYDVERGEPEPWLAQVVRNAAIDRLRRYRADHDDIADHMDAVLAMPPVTSERIDIVRCLSILTPQQRQVILLTFLHGYTNEEVAMRLGIPIGTIKSWIRRSLLRIKDHFEETAT